LAGVTAIVRRKSKNDGTSTGILSVSKEPSKIDFIIKILILIKIIQQFHLKNILKMFQIWIIKQMIQRLFVVSHCVVNNQPRNNSVSTYLDSMEGAKVLELRTPLFF